MKKNAKCAYHPPVCNSLFAIYHNTLPIHQARCSWCSRSCSGKQSKGRSLPCENQLLCRYLLLNLPYLKNFYFPTVDQLLREWLEIMLHREGVLAIEARFCLQNTTQRCGDFTAKQSHDLESIRRNMLPSQPNFNNSQK